MERFSQFGIRSRQEVLNHLNKIQKLEDKIESQNRIIELQAQKIEGLKNQTPWFGSDIDFPGGRK